MGAARYVVIVKKGQDSHFSDVLLLFVGLALLVCNKRTATPLTGRCGVCSRLRPSRYSSLLTLR